MKAAITTAYGPPKVLEIREVAIPEPGNDEVLIKVYASSVNPLDGFLIKRPLFFLPAIGKWLQPTHRIAGADVAGRVASAGSAVQGFQVGDEVFGGSFGKKGAGGICRVCLRQGGGADPQAWQHHV
jgi:NADPH:quinone reductase-like Zn-dependent oxidoreductase